MECKKSKYPSSTWVALWQATQPTPSKSGIADVFLEQLKLQKHQVIAASHKDTDNIHLHISDPTRSARMD